MFEALYSADSSGRMWLPRLARLPVGGHPPSLRDDTDFTLGRHGWGRTEAKLNPPVALLSWLIRNPRAPVAGGLSSDSQKAEIRRQWMEGRHQMLRHLDGAWEIRGGRQVAGFFIVEGDDASEEVPAKWLSFARETVSPGAIAASLPHRGPEEQRRIATAFAGVTTWQRVCREFAQFGLDYAALPDTAS